MKTTIEFMDELKRVLHLTSDYQLAKYLGVGHTNISNYRVGRSRFDDEMAVRIAELLQVDPGYVLACVHAERAQTERARRTWERLAKKLAGAAALLVLASPYLPELTARALHIMLTGAAIAAAALAAVRNCLSPHRPRPAS